MGYGVCSYLRYKNDKDEVHCSLVIAKARVAPSKVTSISRLELAAAVVSAKVSVVLKMNLTWRSIKDFSGQTHKLYSGTSTMMFRGSTYLLQTVFNWSNHASWGFFCFRYSLNELAARTEVSLGACITSNSQHSSIILRRWSWSPGACNWSQ